MRINVWIVDSKNKKNRLGYWVNLCEEQPDGPIYSEFKWWLIDNYTEPDLSMYTEDLKPINSDGLQSLIEALIEDLKNNFSDMKVVGVVDDNGLEIYKILP
jgi:hypothetical protein